MTNAIKECCTKNELAKFYHQTCFSPTTATWTKAIKRNYFTTWPGLTPKLVTKYLHKSEATAMGHMRQSLQNFRSIKDNQQSTKTTDTTTTKTKTKSKSDTYIAINLQHKLYPDQTGRFPVMLEQGHRYIMVAYDQTCNHIFAQPLKSRTDLDLTNAYKKIREDLKNCGISPNIHILYNKCSKNLQDYMSQEKEVFQLMPPEMHRSNAPERAIQTPKTTQ